MKDIKVFVVCHKAIKDVFNEIYRPIVVGANKNNLNYEYKDNTGDNISEKNADYCELTATYWIWKNFKSSIVGLNHYRRFFYLHGRRLDIKRIEKYLKNEEILISRKKYLPSSIESIYERSPLKDYLKILKNVLKANCYEYYEIFKKVILCNYTYPFNMLICFKKDFDAYSSWLFSVLFLVEEEVKNGSISYVPRAYGYLAENLLITWIIKNNKRFKEFTVFNTEESRIRQILRNIKERVLYK